MTNKTELEIITNLIQNIKYPKLDKNLQELNVIENIKLDQNKLTVTLSILNETSFEVVSSEIKNILNNNQEFKNLNTEILSKQNKKEISFGSTANPNNRAPYAKNIIAVTSGKGGVGKTTVSVNLSVALAQQGYKVGLLDADVYGPNTPRMLGVEHERMMWNEQDKIIPHENFGIKIMSVGLTTPESDTPLVWRSSVAISALIQFLEDVAWGDLDFLVIDMPPGTGDIQLTMAEELPITAGIIVTTPQQISVDDVSRAVRMFQDIGVNIGGLVENMSYFVTPDTKQRYNIFGSDGGRLTAQKYGIPFLGEIPLEIEIREFSDAGKPPVAMSSDENKKYYKNIAETLLSVTNINK
jgi:ATP-binding protein involved in chromosome partitioning